MSRRVPDDRLEIIHAQVQGEARRQYEVNRKRRANGREPSPAWMTVDALELGPLLDELKQRRRRAGTFGTSPWAPRPGRSWTWRWVRASRSPP